MNLRDYQQRAIDELYAWFEKHRTGNPCLVLPTGSGKSHIIAALCKNALQEYPETRILMLTHVKELIEQNAEKMIQHWPNAPLGIYSASLRRKDLEEPITFAGIQSIRNRATEIGHIDLAIIDECFAAGTKIATPSGMVDIDKVRCGDVVFNQAGTGIVQAISCKPADVTYLVELDDGRSIECTGNHPFFTQKGWCEARKLEIGSYLLGLEDMSRLWQQVSSLDQAGSERESHFCNAGTSVEEASILLREVCKEIVPNGLECLSAQENQQSPERDQAQAYSAWRERAIASFAAISAFARSWGWVDGRAFNQNSCGPSERDISERIQGRHCESVANDSNRTGWGLALNNKKTGTGSEESSILGGARVVRVSRVEREGFTTVFNLQVSGHPSYFANGIAAHNCHLVSHKDEGGYRKLIAELMAINPRLRVVGLTATPYRLGHGLVTDAPALFNALLEPVSIEELVFKGYLSQLRSKTTQAKLDVAGVHKRGGEFIESELQAAVDTKLTNEAVVREVISRAGDRKAWLFFCTGIDHAKHMAETLQASGIEAACVTGDTPKRQREDILSAFKAGQIRALTNANVLTTGFDYPDIDLIAMVRPTMSASLYVQMAGRGMRPKSHTDHCLVLDFAGVVETHGPITAVRPPKKKGDGNGEAPVKVCEACGELCHPTVKVCPSCGNPFPLPEPKQWKLADVDIMGLEGIEMAITSWRWRKHTSRASGKDMLAVTYYGALSDPSVTEYLTVGYDGYAGQKALRQLALMAEKAGIKDGGLAVTSLEEIADNMNSTRPPSIIEYRLDGKFFRVIKRTWNDAKQEAA